MRIRQNAIVIFSKIEEQTCSGWKKVQWAGFLSFKERESYFLISAKKSAILNPIFNRF